MTSHAPVAGGEFQSGGLSPRPQAGCGVRQLPDGCSTPWGGCRLLVALLLEETDDVLLKEERRADLSCREQVVVGGERREPVDLHEPGHRDGGRATAAGLAVYVHSVAEAAVVLDEGDRRPHSLDCGLAVIDGPQPEQRDAVPLVELGGPFVLVAEVDDCLHAEQIQLAQLLGANGSGAQEDGRRAWPPLVHIGPPVLPVVAQRAQQARVEIGPPNEFAAEIRQKAQLEARIGRAEDDAEEYHWQPDRE